MPDALRPLFTTRSLLRALRHLAVALGVFLVAGNLVILGLHGIARADLGMLRVEGVDGVDKLRHVDGKVWAGANPSREGYLALAAAGVTTVVDLRAEKDAHEDDAFIRSLGMQVVHIPIRDGQTPTDEEVAQFTAVVEDAPGTVYLHCGAGVGRTGSMASAYLVHTGQADALDVLAMSLAAGPPSLEQIAYISALDSGIRPPKVVVGVSRVLDAPRRIWSSLR